MIAANWRAPEAKPFTVKPPEVIEAALVVPPPEVKPVELPKPKPKPVKPKKAKVLSKPKPKPEPVITAKAPPKIEQKTFVEAAPEMKENKPAAYSPVPVFAPPKPPAQAAAPSNTVKPGTAASVDHGSAGKASSGVVVLKRVKPKYPMRALNRQLEGRVTVEFTVTSSGEVENPVVTNASPPDIFNEAALAAIRQWKFKQKIVNGESVEQRAVQTLVFKLER